MMAPLLTCLLLWFSAVVAIPNTPALRTVNYDETDNADTLYRLRRALSVARAESVNDKYSLNRTYLTKSWSDATLFQYGDDTTDDGAGLHGDPGIQIICKTCYINGSVTGDLAITGDFNLTEAVDEVESDIYNIGNTTFDELEKYVENVAGNISTLDFKDIPAWPTLDVDVQLDNLTGLPDAQIHFEFDNLELYLDLDIVLSVGATYTLNLYTSETAAGISLDVFTLGAVFSVDLILIADVEVEIGSGIHIKFDDGLSFDLEMFNSNVSTINLPNGHYEFLPVTIDGEGGSLQALLRLKVSLGVDVDAKDFLDLATFSAGIETDVFAYIADFVVEANSTLISTGDSDSDSDGCELAATAEYTLAVGAGAGATVAIDSYSWGPSPETTVPIWYTTLASICAVSKTATSSVTSSQATITSAAELNLRDDSSTTTLTSVASYTIVNCTNPELINCPVNSQATTSYESTVTAVVTVQSGSTATFPSSTYSSVTSAIAFGTNVHALAATSGAPTSYTPSSASSSATSSGRSSIFPSDKSNGTNNKLIIGLSVGLGVPFLAALAIASGYFIKKRRAYSAVAVEETTK